MKSLALVGFFVFCSIACSKQHDEYIATDPVMTQCFKAKYVGDGCWPVIQVQNGKGFMLNSKWQSMDAGSRQYDSTVTVTSLPEQYKDGHTFYFTISKVDSNIVHVMNCNTPKYVLEISRFSDSSCTSANN